MVGKIPVRNLWLLLLYASNLYNEFVGTNKKRQAEEENLEIHDLIAEILTTEVEICLRRRLTHELNRREADLTHVRGRINHMRTECRRLLQQGRVACSFDEFIVDVPRNRLVVAALDMLGSIVSREDLGQRCRADVAAFARHGVSTGLFDARRQTSMIPTDARNGLDDARMIAAAQLALKFKIFSEDLGDLDMIIPYRNREKFWKLFEQAIAGFYRTRLFKKWRVCTGTYYEWQIESQSPNMEKILPKMKTDMVLEKLDGSHRIIIDTKFTEIITPWKDQARLNSSHIYQLYSYLRSQEHDNDVLSRTSTGILLYPSVGIDYDEWATIQKHKIRFATVDLAADSTSIRERLLDLIPS